MRQNLRPILFGRPGWALAGASIDLDFARDRYYWKRPGLTVTRATPVSYAVTSGGVWQAFNANILRRTDKGVLIEPTRTNVVLHNRDLTNAAWTPTNITAAKDQVGIDGVANAASSLTATAGNGTILQAITLASSARFQSAFVKRITGTGTIEMTMDNGATWTAITVTSSYQQLNIPTQTLANPTVGFRIVTSGDAIAVDFVQNENGVDQTSPIPVTTVAVQRDADVFSLTAPPRFGELYSLYSESTVNVVTATLQLSWQMSVDANNQVRMDVNNAAGAGRTVSRSGGVSDGVVALAATSANTIYRDAVVFSLNNLRASRNGVAGTPDTSAAVPVGVAGAAMNLGVNTAELNGYLRRFALAPTTANESWLSL
jgi:hypothetical protein